MTGIDLKYLILFAVLCMIGESSCTKRIYVPVENVKVNTDTLMMFHWRVDSVIDRDTMRIETNGDTVLKEVVKWRYRTKVENDTVYLLRTDSVMVKEPYPAEKIKEVNRVFLWQKILALIGLLTVIYLVTKTVIRHGF